MKTKEDIMTIYKILRKIYETGNYTKNYFIQGELNAFETVLEISNEDSFQNEKVK